MIRKFVVSDPAIEEGALRFEGTMVPVHALLEYRRSNIPVYEFLVDHPSVRPEHAKQFARWLAETDKAIIESRLAELRGTAPINPS